MARKRNKKNKSKTRIKSLIGNILLGTVCFLLLALLLYGVQLCAGILQFNETADVELSRVKEGLELKPLYDDILKSDNEYQRDIAQLAVLLLEEEEITQEKLEKIERLLNNPQEIIIFDEEGTTLHAYRGTQEEKDFLIELSLSRKGTNDKGISYIAIPLDHERFLAISMATAISEDDFIAQNYDMQALTNVDAGLTNSIIVADRKSGKVIYGKENQIGKPVSNFHAHLDEETGNLGIFVDDYGVNVTASCEYKDYLLICASPITNVLINFNSAVIPALFGFGFLITLLLAYVEFILTDIYVGRIPQVHYKQVTRKRYINAVLCRKLAGFALIGVTCIACIVYCLQLLIRSDEQRQQSEQRLSIAASTLEESAEIMKEIEALNVDAMTYIAEDIRTIIDFKPSLVNRDNLNALARILNIADIYVLNDDGKTVASSAGNRAFAVSSNPQDSTYPFWDVINGFADKYTMVDDKGTREMYDDILYVGIPSADGRGMIVASYSYEINDTWMKSYKTDEVLKLIGVDGRSMLLAIDKDTGKCVFDSSGNHVGWTASDCGIKEEYLLSGYTGTHEIDKTDSLITSRTVLNWVLVYVTPMEWIAANSWLFTAIVIVISMLMVTLSLLPQLIVRTPGEDIYPVNAKEYKASRRTDIDISFSSDGQMTRTESQAERYSPRKRWSERNAGSKLRTLIKVMLVLTGCYLLTALMIERGSGSNYVVNYIMGGNWDRSLNVYAVSYITIVVIGIWLGAGVLQKLAKFVTGTFGRRWKTTGVLISNIIRYAAFIASIFFTLQNIGVETSALVTSASVLTVIFGLGTQSLVADLIAGVFLIFEGTFRVGDIVTIDGWRGEVVEIGLRATKVKNQIGNVKIFQNSRISGAINMTSDQTYAVCDIALPQGEKLEEFEQRLTSGFFPVAAESVKGMQHPLNYEGVVAISGSGATLRISVKCLEGEREQIQRELYRALRLWQEQQARA